VIQFLRQVGQYFWRILIIEGGGVVIDEQGYRHNVGIVLVNKIGQVFWAKRVGQEAWQFPQGGMHQQEKVEETLFRELAEEVGLEPHDVSILGRTVDWLKYRIPAHMIRNTHPVCIGQKQAWFLLLLKTDDKQIRLTQSNKPEFDDWIWVSYWYPLREVVKFKREVYRKALKELSIHIPLGPKRWQGRPLSSILEGVNL
jgi:putative (di)nucleoside polyphosphate hydrolase